MDYSVATLHYSASAMGYSASTVNSSGSIMSYAVSTVHKLIWCDHRFQDDKKPVKRKTYLSGHKGSH